VSLLGDMLGAQVLLVLVILAVSSFYSKPHVLKGMGIMHKFVVDNIIYCVLLRFSGD